VRPPKPPLRITEINADPERLHTPPPDAATAPPPPPMPMLPPRHLAAPRARLPSIRDDQTLVGLAPPERRPEPVNPPPPESSSPTMAPLSVPPEHVKLGRGKWQLSVPSAVAMALIACLGGGITAWINKPNDGDPAAIAKAIRDEMAALRSDIATQNAAIVHRLDGTETKVDRLQDSQDRLRERFNERFAK